MSTVTFLATDKVLKMCKKADDAYYNTTKKNAKKILNDDYYDKLKDLLEKAIKEKSTSGPLRKEIKKYLASTGAELRSSKRSNVLPFHIKSLAKVTSSKLSRLKSIQKMLSKPDYVVGPKLDGLSITLEYTNGKLTNGFTRGDGFLGQSKIDHLKQLKGIPLELDLETKKFYVRGEAVIDYRKFDEKFKDEYSVARNAVSGWINSDEVENKVSKIVAFIAYELLDEKGAPLEVEINGYKGTRSKVRALKYLNSKFKTPYPFVELTDNVTLLEKMDVLYKNYKETLAYEIDGLVLEVNLYSIRNILDKDNTTKYPKFAIAYKQDAKTSSLTEGKKTKCTEISVSVNKGGLVFPTINFDPVVIDNSNVAKASGKNFKHIMTQKIGVGTELSVVKAGGIIPEAYVVKTPYVDGVTPPKYCQCGSKTIMSGPNLYCTKPHKCEYALKSQLEHTLKKLKLTGLGAKNIQKLFDAGYLTLLDLLSAKEKKLSKIEGFGESIIFTIKRGIPEKLKALSEHSLMDCSGKFIRVGLSLAEKTLHDILSGKIKGGERYDLYLERKGKYKEWKKELKNYL